MTTALPWLGWLLVGRRGYRALGTVLVAAAVGVSGTAIYRTTQTGGATFPLKVSSSGRYLTTADGSPFLLVGDSPQTNLGSLSSTNWNSFVSDRAAHGFNALWEWLPCDAYAGPCAADATTYDGVKPFTSGTSLSNYDLATPNDTYFDRAHGYAATAQSAGIAMFLNPMETGHCDAGSFITTLENNGATKAFNFGAYLGTKFADLGNVVWVFGNDYQCFQNSTDDNLVRQLALGIKSTDSSAPMTMSGAFSFSTPVYNFIGYTSLDDTTHDWTSIFTMNWAYPYTPAYADIRYAYGQTPTLPAVMGESNYEGEQNPSTDGCNTIRNCRLQEWWTMTSGATGQFYGCHCGLTLTNANYPNGIDTTGVTQLGYQTSLLKTIAWWTLAPQTNGAGQLITSGGGTFSSTCSGIPCISTNTYVSAAKSADSTLALIYSPGPSGDQTFTVDFSKMANSSTTARWYDPTNGTYTTVTGSPFTNASGAASITAGNGAANSAGDHDWALLLTS